MAPGDEFPPSQSIFVKPKWREDENRGDHRRSDELLSHDPVIRFGFRLYLVPGRLSVEHTAAVIRAVHYYGYAGSCGVGLVVYVPCMDHLHRVLVHVQQWWARYMVPGTIY